MSCDLAYRLNPAYCIYKGVAIERQEGSKISFVISDKKIKKTVRKGFYDFVGQIRCMAECPPEYAKRTSVKFKLKSKDDVEKIVTSQIGGIYTEEQLQIVERICTEKSGLVVIATESLSQNYRTMLHLKVDVDRKDDLLMEQWKLEKRDIILEALNNEKLVFVEMKQSNVAGVLSELKKDNYFSDEMIVSKLKGIIVQDTHEYLEKEDLLADIAVFKDRIPKKAFLKMTDEEKENCFIHYTNFGSVLKIGMERLFEKCKVPKLSKTTSFAVLFCIIMAVFAGCKNSLLENKMNNEIQKSFINTCITREIPSLCDWQKKYRKKWDLSYIGWTRADNFLEDTFSERKDFPLYYGYWEKKLRTDKRKNKKIKGEIYCRSKITDEYSAGMLPYKISGELDYSNVQMNFNYSFFNNCNKDVKSFTIVFYLFDEDGNPPELIRNNMVLCEKKFVESYTTFSTRIPLNKYFESMSDNEYTIDYLYVSKIEFTDGTVWTDPFGMKYLN